MVSTVAVWLSNAVRERLSRCSRAGGWTDEMKLWRLELSLYVCNRLLLIGGRDRSFAAAQCRLGRQPEL